MLYAHAGWEVSLWTSCLNDEVKQMHTTQATDIKISRRTFEWPHHIKPAFIGLESTIEVNRSYQ